MAACCQDERDVEWLQRDVAQCVSVCRVSACRRVTCRESTWRRVVRTSVMSSGSSEMSISVCQCASCGVSRVGVSACRHVGMSACRRVTCRESTWRRVVRTSMMSSGSSEMSLSVCQCVACRRVGVSRVTCRRAGVLSGRA